MSDRTVTRRRVVQGAGILGITGLVGSTTVTAQEQTETDSQGQTGTDDGETAAVRIAHASADAPNVNVRLTSDPDGGDGDPTLELDGLGFGVVSNYTEVDPGTYQLEIGVPNEGLVDQILDLFGGDGDSDETTIYSDSVTVEAGTTYTITAFGELAAGPASTESDTGTNGTTGGNETTGGAGADEAITETEGNETTGDGVTTGTDEGQSVDRRFQVAVLEDDLSAPEEGTARFRVVNTVPDAEAVTLSTVQSVTRTETTAGSGETTDTDGGNATTEDSASTGGDETAASGSDETLVQGLSYGEQELIDMDAGEYLLTVSRATASETDSGVGNDGTAGGTGDDATGNESVVDGEQTENESGMGGQETENGTGIGGEQTETETGEAEPTSTDGGQSATEVSVSLNGGAAHSGFVIGYFDPEAAATPEAGSTTGQTATNTTGTDEQQTDSGTEQTESQGTETERASDVPARSVELVAVKDAQDGERADGGNRDPLDIGQ